eukprot:gb/GECG01011678.1/.p1 GENE.gb/GECG01011678.1/~~gb/GECG01011678.1/.p1  ORF type:complete len:758 (+),score=93.32 gb/GECG01011678.1/:1-2274(+)
MLSREERANEFKRHAQETADRTKTAGSRPRQFNPRSSLRSRDGWRQRAASSGENSASSAGSSPKPAIPQEQRSFMRKIFKNFVGGNLEKANSKPSPGHTSEGGSTPTEEEANEGAPTDEHKRNKVSLLQQNSQGASRFFLNTNDDTSESDDDSGSQSSIRVRKDGDTTASSSSVGDTESRFVAVYNGVRSFSTSTAATDGKEPEKRPASSSFNGGDPLHNGPGSPRGGRHQINGPHNGSQASPMRVTENAHPALQNGPQSARLSTVAESESVEGSSDNKSEYSESRDSNNRAQEPSTEILAKSFSNPSRRSASTNTRVPVSKEEVDAFEQRMSRSLTALEKLESYNQSLKNELDMKWQKISSLQSQLQEIPKSIRDQLENYKTEYDLYTVTPQERDWENSVLRQLKNDILQETEDERIQMENELRTLRDAIQRVEEDSIMSILTNFLLVLLSFFLEGFSWVTSKARVIIDPLIISTVGILATAKHRCCSRSASKKGKEATTTKMSTRKKKRRGSRRDSFSEASTSSVNSQDESEDDDSKKNEERSDRAISAFEMNERSRSHSIGQSSVPSRGSSNHADSHPQMAVYRRSSGRPGEFPAAAPTPPPPSQQHYGGMARGYPRQYDAYGERALQPTHLPYYYQQDPYRVPSYYAPYNAPAPPPQEGNLANHSSPLGAPQWHPRDNVDTNRGMHSSPQDFGVAGSRPMTSGPMYPNDRRGYPQGAFGRHHLPPPDPGGSQPNIDSYGAMAPPRYPARNGGW